MERDPQPFTVGAIPWDASVVIENLTEPYRAGMLLVSGAYRLRVSAPGHETRQETVRHGTQPTRHRVAPEWQAGSVFADALSSGGEGPEMVVIPAGSFRMGCLPNDANCCEHDCYAGEFPVHEVAIRSFALSKHEVTRGEFSEFVRATGHSTGDSCYTYGALEWEDGSGFGWRNPGFAQTDADPVVCVNWEGCAIVCYLAVGSFGPRLPLAHGVGVGVFSAGGISDEISLWQR